MSLRHLRPSAAVVVVAVGAPALAAAQAPAVVGRVKLSTGTAAIVRNGQILSAAVGAAMAEADLLRTGADGRLAVMLRDETRLALGPGSEVAVASFAYAPSDGRLGLTLRVARGALSYVSGLIARPSPASVSIQTPTSVIGVRGTHALIQADAR